MVKRLTTAFSLVLSIAAMTPASAQKKGHSSGTNATKPALKFLDAIQISTVEDQPVQVVKSDVLEKPVTEPTTPAIPETAAPNNNMVETATSVQLKYAILLNTEVEQIQNLALFSLIDEWYGTRYVLGGSSKDGIDCSAFVQEIYAKLFQTPMPRTAKEQYKATRPISRTELKQGDLVFFSTRGSSVSHVGIYLQNNKFVHAATSGGVMVSDLFEDYWTRHFIGAGRYEKQADVQTLAANP